MGKVPKVAKSELETASLMILNLIKENSLEKVPPKAIMENTAAKDS